MNPARLDSTVLASPAPSSRLWSLGALAGRFVELTGKARLTMTFGLVLAAQQKREPVAWIASATPGRPNAGWFFPPDAAECGVDLGALACVQVDGAVAAARAADLLLRSGAFGLVVLDLVPLGPAVEVPMPMQSRLVQLAHKHEAAVICLTEKEARAASLSSLVCLRIETWRGPARQDFAESKGDRLACGLRIEKDKRHGPGWGHVENLRGPPGLC